MQSDTIRYLSQLSAGDHAFFMGFCTHKTAYAYRLEALGLLPGTPLTVVRYAPLGDPIQIRIRNTTFFLRKKDAAQLRVCPC